MTTTEPTTTEPEPTEPEPTEGDTLPGLEPEPTEGDTLPKTRTRKKAKAPADKKPPAKAPVGRPRGGSKKEQMKTDLLGIVGLVGVGLGTVAMGTGNERLAFDARVVMAQADTLAEAWTELALANPAVARAIAALSTGSQMSGVIMATASVALPILVCHGLVPASEPVMALTGLPADLLATMPAPPHPSEGAAPVVGDAHLRGLDLDLDTEPEPGGWAPPVVT